MILRQLKRFLRDLPQQGAAAEDGSPLSGMEL